MNLKCDDTNTRFQRSIFIFVNKAGSAPGRVRSLPSFWRCLIEELEHRNPRLLSGPVRLQVAKTGNPGHLRKGSRAEIPSLKSGDIRHTGGNCTTGLVLSPTTRALRSLPTWLVGNGIGYEKKGYAQFPPVKWEMVLKITKSNVGLGLLSFFIRFLVIIFIIVW